MVLPTQYGKMGKKWDFTLLLNQYRLYCHILQCNSSNMHKIHKSTDSESERDACFSINGSIREN